MRDSDWNYEIEIRKSEYNMTSVTGNISILIHWFQYKLLMITRTGVRQSTWELCTPSAVLGGCKFGWSPERSKRYQRKLVTLTLDSAASTNPSPQNISNTPPTLHIIFIHVRKTEKKYFLKKIGSLVKAIQYAIWHFHHHKFIAQRH